MTRLPGLVLLLAVAVVPASALGTLRPAAEAGALTVPQMLSATMAARLRANGLDPADPGLHDKLVARAARRPKILGPRFLSRFLEPQPPALGAGSARLFHGTVSVTNLGIPLGQPGIDTPVISSEGPANLGVGVLESPLIDGGNLFPTIVLDYGSCGTVTDVPDSEEGSYFPGKKSSSISVYTVTRIQNQWVTPVASKDTPATIAVRFGSGATSNALPFLEQPTYSSGDSVYAQPVGDAAPYLSAGGPLALPVTSFATVTAPSMPAAAERVSTNVADATQTGTDTLGYGVKLVNGWQATATITDVHSYQDAAGNGGASDAFRSATVVQQPQSGRLETKVGWSYEGGESLSYAVKWTFTKGVVIARVADTAPKLTTCTGEE